MDALLSRQFRLLWFHTYRFVRRICYLPHLANGTHRFIVCRTVHLVFSYLSIWMFWFHRRIVHFARAAAHAHLPRLNAGHSRARTVRTFIAASADAGIASGRRRRAALIVRWFRGAWFSLRVRFAHSAVAAHLYLCAAAHALFK